MSGSWPSLNKLLILYEIVILKSKKKKESFEVIINSKTVFKKEN